MAIQVWDGTKYVGAELGRFGTNGTLKEALVWDGTQYVKVWSAAPVVPDLPVVEITGTSGGVSRDQFRAACAQHGVNYQTVQELPFLLDTSQATNLDSMFAACASLTTVPDLDTSQATNLTRMFAGCMSLTTVPDLETSQATNLSDMFAGCASLTTVPDLDTSQATNLSYMFYGCSSLTTVPDLDTIQATDLPGMFYGCSSLTTVPDLETSQATDLSDMFADCSALTDGNVRCIGRHPYADTFGMITGSGLTREPFYDTNGNPI